MDALSRTGAHRTEADMDGRLSADPFERLAIAGLLDQQDAAEQFGSSSEHDHGETRSARSARRNGSLLRWSDARTQSAFNAGVRACITGHTRDEWAQLEARLAREAERDEVLSGVARADQAFAGA